MLAGFRWAFVLFNTYVYVHIFIYVYSQLNEVHTIIQKSKQPTIDENQQSDMKSYKKIRCVLPLRNFLSFLWLPIKGNTRSFVCFTTHCIVCESVCIEQGIIFTFRKDCLIYLTSSHVWTPFHVKKENFLCKCSLIYNKPHPKQLTRRAPLHEFQPTQMKLKLNRSRWDSFLSHTALFVRYLKFMKILIFKASSSWGGKITSESAIKPRFHLSLFYSPELSWGWNG